MPLEQSHRIFWSWLREQSNAKSGLLPGSCVAVDSNLSCRETLFDSQCDRHRRHKLVSAAKASLRQSEDCIEIILLNTNAGVCQLVQSDRTVWVASRLVICNVAVLPPTSNRDVNRR